MAFTPRLTQSIAEGNTSFSDPQTFTCDTVVKFEESIATGSTDSQYAIAIDVSKLQVFYLVADGTCTVETNSGSVPDDTFSLTAGKPTIFRTGDTAVLSADVTDFFITNSSGAAVTVKCIAGMVT